MKRTPPHTVVGDGVRFPSGIDPGGGEIGVAHSREVSKRAILVSLSEAENGGIRVNLDDVVRGDPNGASWNLEAIVTGKVYSKSTFKDMSMSDAELAAFGHYILGRLKAFKTCGEI